MKKHDERVLHLARYLLPALPHLGLSEEAIAEVTRLLEGGDALALEERLAAHPATRAWMRRALGFQVVRGDYAPLPGQVASPEATDYCCPVEGCPTGPYIPFQAGEPVPPCPVHGAALAPCG